MKKPGVLKRLTLTGRLKARLADILTRVRFRELPRMDAGDLILSEVVRAIGRPKNREEREILCESELIRSQLYERSGGATPLEAADALHSAFIWQLELPVDTSRASRFAETALALIPRVERLGSRRTVCRLLRIMLACWAETGHASARVIETLSQLPMRLRRLRVVNEDPGIGDLLEAAGRHAHLPGAAELLAEARTEGLSVLIAFGEAKKTLALESHLRILDREGCELLAMLLADQGHLDVDARRFYRETVEAWPESAARLSLSLRRLTHVDPRTHSADLDEKERLSRSLLARFADEDWPYRNLAAIAAHRGQVDVAVAWFAGAMDRGGEGADVAGLVAASLSALGFDQVAERLIATGQSDPTSSVVSLLARSTRALADGAEPELRKCANALVPITGVLKDRRELLARVHALRGRICLRLGRMEEAADELGRALTLRPDDERLAAQLAGCCLELGQRERALEFVARAEVNGRTRRTSLMRADAEEAAGNTAAALDALEEALAAPDRAVGPKRELRAAWDRIAEAYEVLAIGKASRSPFLRELRAECRGKDAHTSLNVDRIRRRAADLACGLGQPAREAAILAPLARRPDASRRRMLRAARAALRAGDSGLVAEFCERLAARDPDDAAAHALDGLLALRDGRAGEARRRLRAAEQGGYQDVVGRLAHALSHLMEGDAASAMEILEAIGDVPVAARLRLLDLQALALERLGRHDDALESRSEALEIDDDPARRVAYGRLAVSIGLNPWTADRETLLDRGLSSLEGADDPESRALRGLAALALDRPLRADDLVEDGPTDSGELRTDGAVSALRHHLVRWHLRRGELDDAMRVGEMLFGAEAEATLWALQDHAAAARALAATTALREEISTSDDVAGLDSRVAFVIESARVAGVGATTCAAVADALVVAPPATPEAELAAARAQLDTGDSEGAERKLQALFDVVATDRELSRQVIELLHRVREMRARTDSARQLRIVDDAFANGRLRDVLDLTGGTSPTAGLDLATGMLRVRSLAGLGRAQRANRELDEVKAAAAVQGVQLEGVADAQAGILMAAMRQSMHEEGEEALRLWRVGERRRCLDELSALCDRHPEAVAPAFAYALILEADDRGDVAAVAFEEAARRSGEPDPCFPDVLSQLVESGRARRLV